MVFMCGLFAVSNVIHPNPLPFSLGFVEKISNNGMLCLSLVVLFSSKLYSLEFNFYKFRPNFRESSMIHWQPGFERTKRNICIAMHIALDQGHSQSDLDSEDVEACTSNDRSNAQALFLSVFSGIQLLVPRFGRFPSSFGKKKQCTFTVQIVIGYSCFLVKTEQGCHLTEICLGAKAAKPTCSESKTNNFAKE